MIQQLTQNTAFSEVHRAYEQANLLGVPLNATSHGIPTVARVTGNSSSHP